MDHSQDVKDIPSLIGWLTDDFVPLVRRPEVRVTLLGQDRQDAGMVRPSLTASNTLLSYCKGPSFSFTECGSEWAG